ncbi:homoserine dehydrogenase [Methanobacterium petrolearium]|uniref:homoserine dehydrogenase n=1 Tax=Methanobacterium petrolearium TaxID=710190 RepID=UPI001AE4D75A|nr:homoserine dehydrogenase [Methanobacterium petrolearium]MBP1945262.1 homoserine dehydrogenase [Methanobacterium petrolearium]BDZ71206.1 homoserine dehydrogenase [Methanobacterium petrolearium]
MKIVILGFGAVGQGVARVLSMKKEYLESEYGLKPQIVAVSDRSGAAIKEDGLDEELLLETKTDKGKISLYLDYGASGVDSLQVLEDVEYDCLVEVTPTDINDGEPARSHIIKAMADGKDVITSNKGPLALSFQELGDCARKNGVELKFEACVGGAMPIINFAHETLAGCNIESIYGILNGTTNYILSRMANEGSSYEQTLQEAQEMGIAETNPYQDVEGIDAACKIVIMANSILNLPVTLKDVEVEGISKITSESIALAKKEGMLIKLIGEASPDALEVSPRLVRQGSPFAVEGTLNVATLKTDLADDVTVVGKGAGSVETASAILSDIVSIWKIRR